MKKHSLKEFVLEGLGFLVDIVLLGIGFYSWSKGETLTAIWAFGGSGFVLGILVAVAVSNSRK